MFQMDLMMAGSDDWMSVDEVAVYLGKSSHWVYQNRVKLQLPFTPVGGTFRFQKSQVDRWLEQKSQTIEKTKVKKQTIQKITL
jgi:excisionase family DNA binding protein